MSAARLQPIRAIALVAGAATMLGGTAQAAAATASETLTAQQREALLSQAQLDPDFRERLLLDPRTAARELGIDLPDAVDARPRKLEVAVPPLPRLAAAPRPAGAKQKPKPEAKPMPEVQPKPEAKPTAKG